MGIRLPVVVVVLALALAGCGGSDPDDESPVDTSAAEALDKENHAQNLKAKEVAKQKAAAAKLEARRTKFTVKIEKMVSNLSGEAGLVVGAPGGDGVTLGTNGSLSSISAWSTSKVPIAERILKDANGPSGITSTQRSNINRALTLSDNTAALALWQDLIDTHGGVDGAAKSVDKMLRQAGDNKTMVSTKGRESFTPFGQTDWSLKNQNKYMAALAGECISTPASRKYLFKEMSSVTSDTWGFGSAGVPAKWKGGWGPGTDGKYLVRQMGTMKIGGEEAVVTLAAIPDDGSFESGQAMATSIARWAATHLRGKVPEPTPCP